MRKLSTFQLIAFLTILILVLSLLSFSIYNGVNQCSEAATCALQDTESAGDMLWDAISRNFTVAVRLR